jgi:type VI secretion system protein ImpL
VLKAVARQTNIAGGGSSFWSKLNPFSGSKSESAVASQVDKEFRPIIDFAEGKKDPDPLSLYLKSLTEARDLLNGATGDQWAQTSKTLLVSNDPKSFQKTEKSAQDLLAEMQKSSAGTEAAKLLEQPFGNIRAIVVGDMREQIEKEWTEKLYPIARALESGYPFKDASAEASLTDLAKFLNPVDGQLTVFFKEKLESSFDEAGSELKPKEGRLKFSDSFVAYLNNARRLRAALFQSGGKQPDFTYVLTLQVPSGSNSLVEIQSDGSRVDTQNAEQNFKWTGAAGTKITVANAAPVPFSGPWCLFKMFEAGHPSRGADNRYQLAWRVGSTTVQAKLQPPSPVSNPFELKIFRDMRAPASTR